MALGLILLFGYLLIVWLIFFRLKLVKFSPVWGLVSAFILIHVFLIFILGLRFVTPYSKDAKVIQHTIQIIPRLTEPILVTAVLFNPDMPVKKGQPLFQFDRRPYEYKVRQHEAALAAARQNVLVLKAEKQAADDAVVTAGYRVKQQEAALAAAR